MDDNAMETSRFVVNCMAQAIQQQVDTASQASLMVLYATMAAQTSPLEVALKRHQILVQLWHEKELATRRLQDEKDELKRLIKSMSRVAMDEASSSSMNSPICTGKSLALWQQKAQWLRHQVEYLEWIQNQSRQFDRDTPLKPSRLERLKEDPAEQRRDLQGTPLILGRNVLGDPFAPAGDCLQYLHQYDALPVYHAMRSRVQQLLLQREQKRIERLNAKRSQQFERNLMFNNHDHHQQATHFESPASTTNPHKTHTTHKRDKTRKRHHPKHMTSPSPPQDQTMADDQLAPEENHLAHEVQDQFDKQLDEQPVVDDDVSHVGNQKP